MPDGSVLYALINGPAAVCVFFVLSGFVLSVNYFLAGNGDGYLARSAAKRWLRLVGPVFVVTVVSYLLYANSLYFYRQASAITGSTWMSQFGGADADPAFKRTWTSAIYEGLLGTFFENTSHYDVVLWTMYHELLGSFLTFALAFGLKRASTSGALWILLTGWTMSYYFDPRLVSFVAGVAIAYAITRWRIQVRAGLSGLLVLAGLYLFGYANPIGSYSMFAGVNDPSPMRYDLIGIHTAAGCLLVFALAASPGLSRFLSTRPFALLGRLSFPIYLLHVPVMHSVGAGLLVMLYSSPLRGSAYMLAIGGFLIVLVPATFALAEVDKNWVKFVNKLSSHVIPLPT